MLTPYLKRMVVSLGLESIVSIHPHVDRHGLSDLYAGASCLAIPGLTEAFGLVFLEAFAHGCPVIGPRHGGSSEIIHDGINGFLVDPENDDDLTRKLFRILRDSKLTHRFAAEGRKTLESFTVERMVQETIAIYTRVTSRNL
jgi:glycosyltransferase involved in cell wall biosynthesis